jgi:hypothetical protein
MKKSTKCAFPLIATALLMSANMAFAARYSGRIENKGTECACIRVLSTSPSAHDGGMECASPGHTSQRSTAGDGSCWRRYRFVYYPGIPDCAQRANQPNPVKGEYNRRTTKVLGNKLSTHVCSDKTMVVYPGTWGGGKPVDPTKANGEVW